MVLLVVNMGKYQWKNTNTAPSHERHDDQPKVSKARPLAIAIREGGGGDSPTIDLGDGDMAVAVLDRSGEQM